MSLEGTLVWVCNEIVIRLRSLQIWNFWLLLVWVWYELAMSLVWVFHQLVWNDIQNLEGAKAKLKVWEKKVTPDWVWQCYDFGRACQIWQHWCQMEVKHQIRPLKVQICRSNPLYKEVKSIIRRLNPLTGGQIKEVESIKGGQIQF